MPPSATSTQLLNTPRDISMPPYPQACSSWHPYSFRAFWITRTIHIAMSGLSNGTAVIHSSLLFRPQQWITSTTFFQTRSPGLFSCQTPKARDKAVLFSHLFGSLGSQKGKSTVMVTMGSCQKLLPPADVCCTSATALELSLPFAASPCIPRVPHCCSF